MTTSISTEGFLGGGGSGDASAPVIAAQTPTPNTAPGAAGGFPISFAAARGTEIVIRATDDVHLSYVAMTMLMLDGTAETIYQNTFRGVYIDSYLVAVAGGYDFHLIRRGGWPGAGTASNLSVGVQVDAVDAGGNVTSATLYYQLPQSTSVPASPPPPAPAGGAIDVVAAALVRIVSQLRI